MTSAPPVPPQTGATILGCAGPTLGREEAAFLRDADPWGIILFARNVDTPAQLRRLTGDLRAALGRTAPVFVDQEGGRVQRLRAPHWREWLPPAEMIARARNNAPPGQEMTVACQVMRLAGRMIAADLHPLGIDANCAPCLDLSFPQTHPFLKNRLYGNDPGEVALLGRALAQGLLAGGVLPVIKHLPGHGRATQDTHHDLAQVEADAATLRRMDFAPFRALADLPMAMTAHVRYPALDDRPATLSPVVVAAIRNDIGFCGLLMSDDLGMDGLPGTPADRAAGALAAGCDLALYCKEDAPMQRAVVAAAGRMTPQAAARAAAALAWRHAPEPADLGALEADLIGLLDGDARL